MIGSIAPLMFCSKCDAPVNFNSDELIKYFNNIETNCESCHSAIDWWATLTKNVQQNFMLNQAFNALDAKTNIVTFTLEPKKRTCIKLSYYYIPKNARILHINYTSQSGNLFPLEIHGNVPHRRIIGDEIWLYPSSFGNEPEVETKVSMLVTWVNHSPDEHALISITDAFEAYVQNKYEDAIVPANVAVESVLSIALSSFLSSKISKDRVKSFLSNAATYSHQLNVVLPLITELKNLPPLADEIRGQLNRLRDFRNQISHKGRTDSEIEKDDIAIMLCAAVFGFRYVLHIQSLLHENA